MRGTKRVAPNSPSCHASWAKSCEILFFYEIGTPPRLVVGKDTLDQVLSRLSTVEKGIGRPLHPTVYSAAEFKSKLASGNQFLTSVLKGQKVFLVGDEDELRKVGGVRLAKAGTDYPRRNQDLLGIVECSLAGSKVKSVLPSSQSHHR
jgi:hypothetical protein